MAFSHSQDGPVTRNGPLSIAAPQQTNEGGVGRAIVFFSNRTAPRTVMYVVFNSDLTDARARCPYRAWTAAVRHVLLERLPRA